MLSTNCSRLLKKALANLNLGQESKTKLMVFTAGEKLQMTFEDVKDLQRPAKDPLKKFRRSSVSKTTVLTKILKVILRIL